MVYMSKFCHHCGKQMPSIAANFCSFCGTSLSSLSSTPTPPKQQPVARTALPSIASPDEDDDYIDRLEHLNIQINRLDVEIVKDNYNVETVGSIRKMALPEGARLDESRAGPFANIDNKQFLEQFQKEAGTIRQNEK